MSEAPLFEGIGTHYAHIYVGTPPQRVSVIVDTGSHHTAFPCEGCSNCGTHTDAYYKPSASSSNKVRERGRGRGRERRCVAAAKFARVAFKRKSWCVCVCV